MRIGITERGDAALDLRWKEWVNLGRPAILITKDPMQLHPHLNSSMNIIVHCTITGYGGSVLEPNVPSPEQAVLGMIKIIDVLGIDRVVLRVDPIIPCTFEIKPTNIKNIINDLSHGICDTIRKRISFLDNYNHVRERFKAVGLKPLPYDMHAPLADRLAMWDKLGRPEVCGEPNMECTGCISQLDLYVFGLSITGSARSLQRSACMCLAAKHELLSSKSQCHHKCIYCYWK